MGIVVYEPRDQRYGELGAGLGQVLGGFLQKRQQNREIEEVQQAFINMAAATNKSEYMRAAAPLLRDANMAMQVQKRADERYSKQLQEYEVSMLGPQGEIIEGVKWMGEPNMDLLALKDDVNQKMGQLGYQFTMGTPKTQVDLRTGKVIGSPVGTPREFASLQGGKSAILSRNRGAENRKLQEKRVGMEEERLQLEREKFEERSRRGEKEFGLKEKRLGLEERGVAVKERLAGQKKEAEGARKQRIAMEDYLATRGVTPEEATKQQKQGARRVMRERDRLEKQLANIYAEKFGPDWATYGKKEPLKRQASILAEDYLYQGHSLPVAIDMATQYVELAAGIERASPEQRAAVQQDLELRGQEADEGGLVSSMIQGLKAIVGMTEVEQPEGEQPTGEQPPTAEQPQTDLVRIGTRGPDIIRIPSGMIDGDVINTPLAVQYLIDNYGMTADEAKAYLSGKE